VAVVDDKIYGSGQKKTASLIGPSRDQINQIYWDNKPIATSRYLFCRNRTTGSLLWSYQRSGGGSVIINPCIAIGGDSIYFIESRNSTAVSDADGRVPAATLFSGSNEYLVKLNRTTGVESFAVLIDLPFQHMAYLSYADSKLIAVGSWYSGGYKYENRAYNPSNGSLAWSSNYNIGNTGNSHGEQDQHPCFVGDTLYSRQYKVNMTTGATSGFALARGNCGTQSGCPTHLFGRNFNGYMYALPSGSALRVTQETRVSCWINMIPAAGLLLVPDGGSGCNCSYPFQASMAFMAQ
jgi:outer membrane protein assembly factor BamB